MSQTHGRAQGEGRDQEVSGGHVTHVLIAYELGTHSFVQKRIPQKYARSLFLARRTSIPAYGDC